MAESARTLLPTAGPFPSARGCSRCAPAEEQRVHYCTPSPGAPGECEQFLQRGHRPFCLLNRRI
jgi:hypothetical protein